MASPSSSSSPAQETNNKPPIFKKTQPLPWTHQETINLIQSYQDKWYSLKKGQLKSSQWEQVSLTVAARCGYHQPSKSATQCRHKIEKLRKRYRAERLKPYPDSWPYFHLMDSMETGPMSVRNSSNLNNSTSINRIVQGGIATNVERNVRASFGVSTKDFYDEDDEDEDDDSEEDQGTHVATALALQITTFAENFFKVEHNKIQMMRETAKYQMEMENQRMKLIIESHRKIVDTIYEAFSTSHKKMKTSP